MGAGEVTGMKQTRTRALFATFFKIGAFTFGGGYAMVALLQNEFVEEKKWVTKEEFLARIGKYGTNVHVQQDEVFEYFLSILQTAIDLRDEQNTNLSSKTLKKALAYIDEHYTSENLSLGTVACEVQVGANYLSSVFSQNMQKTFTEYISEKRMEKAKKLLKSTELPTSEIAAQVGYKDPHYFSFVFKKTQGCSPREYRSGI